uniref:Fatty acid hydroxylase domain-containing protein n=1 Tax=Arcella intermedia TaxID=1963864 RepID=A0A6B2LFY8_9EUKA
MVVVGMELQDALFTHLLKYKSIPKIPIRGPHLDKLGLVDYSFVVFNKITTPLFLYHLTQFCYLSSRITWSIPDLPSFLWRFFLAVPALFIIYDFFYCFFHRFLHHPSVYRFVHKHHHQQNAPTRGLVDALNTHPFEYVTGEWDHLFATYLLTLVMEVPVQAIMAFMLIGSFLAGLNHTRLDIGLWLIYQVKHHDAHHRYPTVNYGQYIVLWDLVFKSYQESRESRGNNVSKRK